MAPLPFSQAAKNNKGVILDILRDVLSGVDSVLEIGSGTGQHAVWFAQNLLHLSWQPSDRAEYLDGLILRLEAQAPENVRQPVALDVADDPWPVNEVQAIFSANSVHIMSWQHVEKLFVGVGNVLSPGGFLVLYGPYKYNGEFTTPSNENFDGWLKERDAASGIRDFEKVNALAQNIGLSLVADYAMPANNQCLVWRRRA